METTPMTRPVRDTALPTYELQHLASAIAPATGWAAVVHDRGAHLYRDGELVEGPIPLELLRAADRVLARGELTCHADLDGEDVTLRCTRLRLAGTTLAVIVGGTRRPSRPTLDRADQELTRIDEQAVHGAEHAQRTPLTVITGFSRTLRAHWRELDVEDVDLLLDGLERHARRLETLLARRELLDLRREDVDRRTVDVDELVASALRTATAPGDERVIAAPARLRAELVPELFELLLVELLDNGLERGGASRVEVVTRSRAATLEVSVDDDGSGVQDRASAVMPFVGQADGSSAGLGLALARRVAQLHGGDLEVHDRPEGGTRVLAWFPDAVVEA